MSGLINFAANQTRTAYDLAFQVSPIILQGGIAASIPGGMMPIIALTGQLAAFAQGVASGAANGSGISSVSTDAFFARYIPAPGATFIAQRIGNYPFANQQVAGNAVIRDPNTLSLVMICPIKEDAGYLTKLPILSAFWAALEQHNGLGGTYVVSTPAKIFTNGVFLGATALDSGESKQQQIRFQLDFWFPLITQAQATQAMGNLMQTITNGGQITGTPSWTGAAQSALAQPLGLPI